MAPKIKAPVDKSAMVRAEKRMKTKEKKKILSVDSKGD